VFGYPETRGLSFPREGCLNMLDFPVREARDYQLPDTQHSDPNPEIAREMPL